jgi:hypothetical protein
MRKRFPKSATSRCPVMHSQWMRVRNRLLARIITMSASHTPTDLHLRQHRAKKRAKLRARIAAAPMSGRAALEARVERTYSAFHIPAPEKPPSIV